MIGKLLTAFIGRGIDRRDGKGGLKGAVIGAAAPVIIRRMGSVGLLLGSAYLAKKAWDSRKDEPAAPTPA